MIMERFLIVCDENQRWAIKGGGVQMARVLENHDVSSLYPNIVRIFGYSSRNQKDKQAYIDLLKMRLNAKHGKLSKEFLDQYGLTNNDLKIGLKLPLNAYT